MSIIRPLIILFAAMATLAPCGVVAAERPNIVYILADDLGYGDVNLAHPGLPDRFRHPVIQTPNLARLAAESVVFTDHYAAAPTCSPSRAGLLTGRTPFRMNIPLWIDDRQDNDKVFLRGWELTIPELLKPAGYVSAVFGKWHLNGVDWERRESWQGWTGSFPLQQGFTRALISKENPHVTRELAQNTQHNPGDFFDGNGQAMGVLPGWTSQIITDYAIEWMREQVDRKQPFFLYLPYDAVHEKVDNPDEWNARYQTGDANKDRYFANVSFLDHQIGRLLRELDSLGIGNDTIVFFSSDNGPEVLAEYWGTLRSYGTSHPLHGQKRQLWEGGIRVPGMFRWPGKIAPRISREPNSTLDVLPTLAELTGARLPTDRELDGTSLAGHLLRSEPVKRSKPLYWQLELAQNWEMTGEGYERRYDGTRKVADQAVPQVVIREGNYELRGMHTGSSPFQFPRKFELFDVVNDPAERNNLVDSEPARFDRMLRQMKTLHESVNSDRKATKKWIADQAANSSQEITKRPAVDICVYGGTASGVMAAVAARREGRSVTIVEPSRALGGMVGGGIQVNQDTRHPGDIGGLTRLMMEKDIEIGGGPHENQPKFREAFADLAKKHGIEVIYHHRLGKITKIGTRIESMLLDYAPVERDGCPATQPQLTAAREVAATMFIDASYEGDLLALAGVRYAVGREARKEFNESLAGQRNLIEFDVNPYVVPGDPRSGLLPMIDSEPYVEGGASRHIMAYNFRPLWVPAGQGAKVGPPSHLDLAKYELLLRALKANPKYVGWPNHNYSRGTLLSGGILGRQADYPDGSWSERAKVWREWIDHVKIMHQLTRSTAELKKGEYPESDNDFPDQLYVRLGRRMRGEYVLTQHDLMLQTDIDDSIGLGYGWVGWVDMYPSRLVATPNGKVASEGECHETVSPGPYRIPYRAIIPKAQECTNLLVPVCLSATHIAQSSIRMEGTWMLIGESAGIAAAQALKEGVAVQNIDRGAYRRRLLEVGQILEWDGTGYGGGKNAWWNKRPEDYSRHTVSTLLKGPRKQSEFVRRVETDQRPPQKQTKK